MERRLFSLQGSGKCTRRRGASTASLRLKATLLALPHQITTMDLGALVAVPGFELAVRVRKVTDTPMANGPTTRTKILVERDYFFRPLGHSAYCSVKKHYFSPSRLLGFSISNSNSPHVTILLLAIGLCRSVSTRSRILRWNWDGTGPLLALLCEIDCEGGWGSQWHQRTETAAPCAECSFARKPLNA